MPGVDRIDFILPDHIAEGCLAPFAIEVEGQANSRIYTLSVSRGDAHCAPELLLPGGVWQKWDAGEKARLSVLSVERRDPGVATPEHFAMAWTADYTAAELSALISEDIDNAFAPYYCHRLDFRRPSFSRTDRDIVLGMFGSLVETARVEFRGPGGCVWPVDLQPDRRTVMNGPANCPPETFRFDQTAGAIEDLPPAVIPLLGVEGGPVSFSLLWLGNQTPTPLVLRHRLTVQSGGALGRFAVVSETTCRLTGERGEGEVRVSTSDSGSVVGWAAVKRTVVYRGLEAGPGVDAMLLRLVRLQAVPFPLVGKFRLD